MATEIERKFLVTSEDWRAAASTSAAYLQAYVAIGEDRSVRVRLIDEQSARLTIKIGRGTLARDEYEYDIPVADAQELVGAAIGTVIEKTRYLVPHAGFTWEVDVFTGFYHGLVVAEVELRSEADDPPLPPWIGAEVTGDRRYSNMVMATEDLSGELPHGLSHSPL
ncbi:CYTH domain-containing protein [Neorhizobium galegae]|uniref:CYTH domain-containing protein n=1 Tax=Rhizobium/Agrobacterium group TaxID=227290 RepID=UPI001AE6FABC|nr:CYTH domain-containing protein [Neorhizobium galegae]MBP2549989.1 CYTH domain-containing protein [Neorhizobium galegae]